MNDELERVWEEAVVAQLRYYPRMSAATEKNHENTVMIAVVQAEIRIEHLQNTSLECYS
jgi:hypothetical protein